MPRLFVTLSIPDPIAELLATMQNGVERARWRPVENFHLTLAFIGETDGAGLNTAIDALSQIDAPAFDVRLSGAGYFGERKPRQLWVGAERAPRLAHLHSKVEASLRNAGFELERRKFVPHVTLAYLSGVARDAVLQYCAANGSFECAPFSVSEFHLYSSELSRSASHYQVEASYSLSPSM